MKSQMEGEGLDIVRLNDVLVRSGSAVPLQGRSAFETTISEPARRGLDVLRKRTKAEPSAILRAVWAVTAARLTGAMAVTLADAAAGAEQTTLQRIGVDNDATVSRFLQEALHPAPIEGNETVDSGWAAGASVSAGAQPGIPLFFSTDGNRVICNYDLSLYNERLVRQLIGWMERSVEALAAAKPTAKLAEVAILVSAERRRLLEEWNNTAVRRDPKDSVDLLFRQVARMHADTTAVVGEKRSLTYGELDKLSDDFARRLAVRGITRGSVVALMLERSVDAIVAVLGVVKAGAAYLPLDPSQPADRLRFMLDDGGAALIVSRGTLPDRLPSEHPPLILLDGDSESAEPSPAPATRTDGESLAYLMYTSGSTGTPKGVEIRHRSIIRLVRDVEYVPLHPTTVMLHAAPLGFDASTLEIWGPLLNGGRIVIHEERLPTPQDLARTIRTHGVTTAWLTAALFNTIVDDDPRWLEGLRHLLIGGEALSVSHVRRALAALPRMALINGYGPTECTTFSTTYAIPHDLPGDAHSIPIGRPIADTSLYILNARLEPVPTGVIGELYIGGLGVGRGYLRRPELNEQKFVPNPFGRPDERLYRTGDLVRYLDDGNVEFIGRRDGQVKIRGFRIETGEIEATLNRFPGVKACAVVARRDHDAEARLVAYVVASEKEADFAQLRKHAAKCLPEFMVPAAFMRLDELPLTVNGKLDRRALPAPGRTRPELSQPYEAPLTAVEERVCTAFAAVLELDRVGRRDNFFELGGSSLFSLRVLAKLRDGAHEGVSVAAFFRDPTPAAVAAQLGGTSQDSFETSRLSHRMRHREDDRANEPVAVIAMAGRFPGAADVDAFWENLCAGKETIKFFSDDELDPSIPRELRGDPGYIRARGVIDGVELFDAAFFGINPKEAELMDPQQRIFLELCWECLERAGHVPDASPGPVGIFAGMNNATYFQNHVSTRPDLVERVGAFQVMLANEKDYITTRTAHRLNLTGPAISVNTACSTSLVAVSQAFDSLRNGQCDMALAGGASITCPPHSGYLYQEGAMLSPDGHTRTFDAEAQGTVFCDGAAVVLLKRLADAIEDGDTIYAVIRGTAVNNDGSIKASFTAPSVDGQASVIALAHDVAGIDSRTVSYLEAHGTATPLGDPIEIASATKAFHRGTRDVGFCRIGSLKSNVGHLVIAAGVAGLIKTALALHHRRIPPSLNFKSPNPNIDFASTPFVPLHELLDWRHDSGPRRAGVSAFGVGGTNAHVVLEEAPPQQPSDEARGPQLLLLSARTPAALTSAAQQLTSHLQRNPEVNLADVAYTLRVGRKAFPHRAALVAEAPGQAVAAFESADPSRWVTRSTGARAPDIAFMFPGQGAQYAGMGHSLYKGSGVFRATFDECARLLLPELRFDLRDRVFSDDPASLAQTSITQPATFVLEYSLAKLWESMGVRPTALIGHSVGEFVCAVLAGVFSLEDGLRLVARRAQLMQAQPAGAMLSVRLSGEKLRERLPTGLSLAAENAPAACVVSGQTEAVARFQQALEAEGIPARLLVTSHAFHSAMMDAVIEPFETEVRKLQLSAPRVPIASTLTGEWLTDIDATSPEYWARHLRQTVLFSRAVRLLIDRPERLLLELGPRQTLATLARQHFAPKAPQPTAVSSLSESTESETPSLLLAMGQLWGLGAPIDLSVLHAGQRRKRIVLPTYPFERKRYWIDATAHQPRTLSQPQTDANPATGITFPETTMATPSPQVHAQQSLRRDRLIEQLRRVFDDVAGVDLSEAGPTVSFMELGLDSLMLTQVALQMQKVFSVKLTFRQLMTEYRSLDALAGFLDSQMPPESPAVATPALAGAAVPTSAPVRPPAAAEPMQVAAFAMSTPATVPAGAGSLVQQVIQQQMQLMAQQLTLLQGQPMASPAVATLPQPALPAAAALAPAAPVAAGTAPASPASADEEVALAHRTYDVKKAFGAIARIHTSGTEISERQRARLDAFMRRYIEKTRRSKDYTTEHRPHMADPRVVNGFRPQLKEIIYQIVIDRSKGSHMWDLDGNEYVDALNGFGMSLFGWQPDFVVDAVRTRLDSGYDIGPQHPLAGQVAKLICELTGFDRAGLCNTGSEAVMGCMRIARTITGRSKIAIFNGAYHGIFDEVIVRGTKKLKAVPAAPGILPNTAENVVVLDYGTPETLQWLKNNAGELAAVLVEPVQSRRPDFQPREFLRELRTLTEKAGSLLIFDEVVTGFRCHPGGIQALFGIRADLASYGKVMGGGFPIGVIAGKREFMDALDGGHWQYGDDSIPTVGVTYFAGTFVRHPLALVAAKAVLEHLKREGPELQATLTRSTAAMVDELNAYCREVGAPIVLKSFSSVWKIFFNEEHPLQDLLFAMMRNRGVHILDNFPCFMTTAHTAQDIAVIKTAFKEAVAELQEADFIPRPTASAPARFDASRPPMPGARLGRDTNGNPAWFVANPDSPGKYIKVETP